jgi:hypothetical protein
MAQHIGDLTTTALKQATVHIATNYEPCYVPLYVLCVLTPLAGPLSSQTRLGFSMSEGYAF